jgi:hypothetical protein
MLLHKQVGTGRKRYKQPTAGALAHGLITFHIALGIYKNYKNYKNKIQERKSKSI